VTLTESSGRAGNCLGMARVVSRWLSERTIMLIGKDLNQPVGRAILGCWQPNAVGFPTICAGGDSADAFNSQAVTARTVHPCQNQQAAEGNQENAAGLGRIWRIGQAHIIE
jgi:hypothetical protein